MLNLFSESENSAFDVIFWEEMGCFLLMLQVLGFLRMFPFFFCSYLKKTLKCCENGVSGIRYPGCMAAGFYMFKKMKIHFVKTKCKLK